MKFTSIPVIVILCYITGEIYKVLFRNKPSAYQLIPILVMLFGGGMGVAIYFLTPEMLAFVTNGWDALTIGIVSGGSATSTNQIIKQLFLKKE